MKKLPPDSLKRISLGLLLIAMLSLSPPATPSVPPGAFPSAQAVLKSQPQDVIDELFDDHVVLIQDINEGGGFGGFIKALVIFEQPPKRVMRLMTQTERQKEFRPDLKSVETVEWFQGGNVDEHHLKIMFVSLSYRVRNHFDYDGARMEWKLDPDYENDLVRLEGFWEFHQLAESRTLGRFGTAVDVGPAVPGFIQDMASKKNVPETMDRIRRWVDSDGTWRP